MAGWATVTALMDPERADMVATLGEVTGRLALEQLYRSMLADPEGREILRARPVINEATVDLAALAALPDGTLGKSYSNFMKENNFSPDGRSPVKYVDDPDLAYVMRSGGGGGGKWRGSREVLARTFIPWAVRAGRRARRPLVCVWYEKRWEQPLELVRRDLGVEMAPQRG
ncbi:unnamed protein product [Ectocarpus sp. CCAP 1310/34]|nr:unnamed protein product [Ectocarpus sp. CCAP 1310/34]